MADDKKISGLPAAGTLTGVELVPVVQGGATVKTTTQNIANLAQGGGGAVESVNGQVGIVELDKTDIGLSDVDNTPDALKPVSTPQATAIANKLEALIFAASDETTALTVGTNKTRFAIPYAFIATAFKINVNTAPTGASLIVNIKKNGTTVFSTNISIDASETTSLSAAVPYVLAASPTPFAADDIVSVDVVQVGSAVAGNGLKVTIIGHQ